MFSGGGSRELRNPFAEQPSAPAFGAPGQMAMPAGQMAMPAMPGTGAPGQMAVPAMMPGGMPHMPATGMQMLTQMQGLEVQEQADILQEATALLGMEIQMGNKYKVLDLYGNQTFWAFERTSCCRRQMQTCCCQDCAPWEVDIHYTPGAANVAQQFLRMERPCGCTCCCLNRPTALVFDAVTNRKIGSFRDPCTCCALTFQVRDTYDGDVLRVNGGCCCCQPGWWCPMPCGPCKQITFQVEDARTNQAVAQISKKVPGCASWCFTPDVDNYKVDFEDVHTPEWKAILLAMTIFMDFRYFNSNRNNDLARRSEMRRSGRD